jgi:AraC-like DNA-binding protein
MATRVRPNLPARSTPGGTVRIGTVSAIPMVLRKLGADPDVVLAEAGLDLGVFVDPDNRISYVTRSHLMALCVARTGCKHFGLLIGQQSGLQSLGLLGLLVKYESDVGAALRSLVHFQHLHMRGAVVTLAEEAGTVTFAYDTHQPRAEATEQVGDGALATIFNIMRQLCGPDWRPTEARFAHRKPEDIGPFRRFFSAPLVFDAEHTALDFAADWLGHALPVADADLSRLLQRQINALEARHGDDFPSLVRGVLSTALLTSRCMADDVAGLFSMHARTLHRRLRVHGTSFRVLAEEGRYEIARQLLENTSMDVSEIAAALDYADDSAFTRAFRRWSGAPPARWRARRGAE